MVLAATMTSVSESSAKHRRGMAGVENYELSFEHVPDLSGLHLRCAGGRLYSPTRIRRRLVVYPGACVMRVAPVLSVLHLWCAGGRLYSPTRIRRRLAVYQSACSTWTCVPPVGCRGPSVWRTGDVVDDASDASDIVVIVGTTRTGLSREGPACIHADTWLACVSSGPLECWFSVIHGWEALL